MGQYHVVVNLDKKEYLYSHDFGDGLKLREFGESAGGMMTGLAYLLAVSNGRGGGDVHSSDPIIGSWGGDRIAIVGDYAADTDLPAEYEASTIFDRCYSGEYKNVGAAILRVMDPRDRSRFGGPMLRPDMVVTVNG